ncbi:hypothetical protein VFPFJ_08842 [Purpureocillium lilacinum]|uniref:Uncharacterized protein n=1 Tax=Purpureocillium lilacinum TaxID=33203 RepID=A0A179H0Y7_PURLI|nr:hypothetical protein VFPFJ_08842 [Purpureocillium lilacinum]OAQ83039.1 hypothetical protein VFPFJ_08842 [Purpureocillium lilacinum]
MWQPATLSPASLNTSTTTLVITLGLPPRLAGKPHAPCLLMQSVAYDRPRPKWTKASELVVASWGDHRGRLANCLRHAALADLQLHRNRRGLTKRPPTAELRRGPAPRGQPVKQAQDALSPDDARPTQRGLSDETRPADRLCVAAYQDQARPCHQRFEAVAARRRDAPGPGLPGLMASSSKAPGCTTLQEPRKAVSLGRPRSPSVLAPRLIGGVASLDVSPGTVARQVARQAAFRHHLPLSLLRRCPTSWCLSDLLLAARRILVARHARFLSLRSRKRRLPRSPSSLPYSHVETTQKPEVRLRTAIATARACAAWSSFRNHKLIGAAARLLAYQLVPARPRFCLEAHIARNGACWLMSRRGTRRRLTRS